MIDLVNKQRKKEMLDARRRYRNAVDKLTDKVCHLVPGIEKRKWKEWDLDHIIPVSFGFENNIPPENIAMLSNLRMIPHIENSKKGQRVTDSLKCIGLDDTFQTRKKKSSSPLFLGGYYICPISKYSSGSKKHS